MSRLALVIGSVLLIAGCAPKPPIGSVEGGECKLTSTPQYAVLGKTDFDQRWINRTTEALVVGCNQPRPRSRVRPGWDTYTVGGKTVPVPPVAPAPAKKARWKWKPKS
jgi:hypothetical protein